MVRYILASELSAAWRVSNVNTHYNVTLGPEDEMTILEYVLRTSTKF